MCKFRTKDKNEGILEIYSIYMSPNDIRLNIAINPLKTLRWEQFLLTKKKVSKLRDYLTKWIKRHK